MLYKNCNFLDHLTKNLSDQEKQEEKDKSIPNIINDTQEEIDQLILTKNALTAVKDDLVRTVDKKMIENDELEAENRSLLEQKVSLQRQVKNLQNDASQIGLLGKVTFCRCTRFFCDIFYGKLSCFCRC